MMENNYKKPEGQKDFNMWKLVAGVLAIMFVLLMILTFKFGLQLLQKDFEGFVTKNMEELSEKRESKFGEPSTEKIENGEIVGATEDIPYPFNCRSTKSPYLNGFMKFGECYPPGSIVEDTDCFVDLDGTCRSISEGPFLSEDDEPSVATSAKAYMNKEFGVTFQYPGNMKLTDEPWDTGNELIESTRVLTMSNTQGSITIILNADGFGPIWADETSSGYETKDGYIQIAGFEDTSNEYTEDNSGMDLYFKNVTSRNKTRLMATAHVNDERNYKLWSSHFSRILQSVKFF